VGCLEGLWGLWGVLGWQREGVAQGVATFPNLVEGVQGVGRGVRGALRVWECLETLLCHCH